MYLSLVDPVFRVAELTDEDTDDRIVHVRGTEEHFAQISAVQRLDLKLNWWAEFYILQRHTLPTPQCKGEAHAGPRHGGTPVLAARAEKAGHPPTMEPGRQIETPTMRRMATTE